MSGRVVHTPRPAHSCAPGWTYGPVSDGTTTDPEYPPTPKGHRAAHPPDAYQYPKGTVWECGECGRTWVSTGPVAPNAPGVCEFHPESRWARRRREKARHRGEQLQRPLQ